MAIIYKIENKINKKIYIGYTEKTLIERFDRHCVDSFYKHRKGKSLSYFHRAIVKYGKENFKLSIVKELSDEENRNWEEFEKFYIEKYQAMNNKKGYNTHTGGNKPPTQDGFKNIFSKLSKSEFNLILEDLKNFNKTKKEISDNYNISMSTINRINNGKIRRQENINYPIRNISENDIRKSKAIYLLTFTNLSNSIIADIVNLNKNSVSQLNTGKIKTSIYNSLKFPLRENKDINKDKIILFSLRGMYASIMNIYKKDTVAKKAIKICAFLINTELDYNKISKIVDFYKRGVYEINKGRLNRQFTDIFIFPIRDNLKDNKEILSKLNAVETIPLIGK